jgi:hypothetical protein
MPIHEFYPFKEFDDVPDPLEPLLFRQLCLYLVNTANILWPDLDLDQAVQKLFDDFLKKTIQTKGLLFTNDFKKVIPSLFKIWSSYKFVMTARQFIQLIPKLGLPYTPSICVQKLSDDDVNIKYNIERNISFVQFAEAIIRLIIQHKEMEQAWVTLDCKKQILG